VESNKSNALKRERMQATAQTVGMKTNTKNATENYRFRDFRVLKKVGVCRFYPLFPS